MLVGLSESFKLLARGVGPTESSCNYAMEKDKGKLEWKERKKKKGKGNTMEMRGKQQRVQIYWFQECLCCYYSLFLHYAQNEGCIVPIQQYCAIFICLPHYEKHKSRAAGQSCGPQCYTGKNPAGAWKERLHHTLQVMLCFFLLPWWPEGEDNSATMVKENWPVV